MNDHEALKLINEVFDRYYEDEMNEVEALNKIAFIVGFNHAEHILKGVPSRHENTQLTSSTDWPDIPRSHK